MISGTIFQKICKKSAEHGLDCSAENESLLIKMFDSEIRISSPGTSLSIRINSKELFDQIYKKYSTISHNKNDFSFFIDRDDVEEFIDAFAQCTLQNFISDPIFEKAEVSDIESTESEAKTKLRKGQDWLRERAMRYWNRRCAVTGVEVPEILEACHIKPWSDKNSTARERLSVENVIILSIHFHRLFDAGLISFADDGKILISEKLSEKDVKILFANRDISLSRQLTAGQKSFLAYHRENIFQDR